MSITYGFTEIASTTELHRMGAMSLYQGDPVISGGVYTNGVERLVSGVWDNSMADIPNGGYLYGHTQVKIMIIARVRIMDSPKFAQILLTKCTQT